MVLAALVCFATLLVAWVLAPDEARPGVRSGSVAVEPEAEVELLLEAA